MRENFFICLAKESDITRIQNIEKQADTRFTPFQDKLSLPQTICTASSLNAAIKNNTLWVIQNTEQHSEICGFLFGTYEGSIFFIEEVSVLPKYGRQGLATALLQTVFRFVINNPTLKSIALITFKAVPWNQDFYQKLGFQAINPYNDFLRKRWGDELQMGFVAEERVLMEYIPIT
ncbi:MAG: GNAT family N-acetyltransferase [Spirochaetota bacterium]